MGIGRKLKGKNFRVDTSKYVRAYLKVSRNVLWKNILNKTGYIVEILVDDIPHEDAKELEIFLISLYGRRDLGLGNLVNMTDGGEGSFGRECKQESKDKIAAGNRGKVYSEETRKKWSELRKGSGNPMFGIKRSAETIQKTKDSRGEYKCKDSKSSKLVLCEQTGIFYDCVREAAESRDIPYDRLRSYLTGTAKNKTPLKYC